MKNVPYVLVIIGLMQFFICLMFWWLPGTYIFTVCSSVFSDMSVCVICSQLFTKSCDGKKRKNNICLVLKKVYKLNVQNCACLLNLVCTKCYYKLTTAVVNRKNLRHSWEKLPSINQLPSTVTSVNELCVKCTNILGLFKP